MTFKEFKFESSVDSRGMRRKRRLSVVICNFCSNQFEKQGNLSKQQRHYCNKVCLGLAFRSGGSAFEARKKTFQKNWGADSPMYSPTFIEHLRSRYRDTLGVDNPFKSETVKQKMRQTNVERYGVEYASQSPVIRKKIEQHNLEYHGVANVASSSEIKQKTHQTNIERYGHKSPLSNHEVQAKRRATNVIRYGFEHPHSNADVRARYYETLQKNASFTSSKPEDRLYAIIVSFIDADKVKRHTRLNGWLIDIQIDDIIIQLDGVYWHGLDRPIDEIRKLQNPQALSIVRKFDRDRQQDDWFLKNGYTLVRFTDVYVNKMSDDELIYELRKIIHEA